MKPTQITELFANIRSTIVSFFSILRFVALGVGVFLGISWAGPALQNAADNMFREGQFHNFQIQFPYGLTDDDLKQLSAVEGVTSMETARQSFQTLKRGDAKQTVKLQTYGREIDVPFVVEGELPRNANELAFHAESARLLGVNVGDTLVFEHDADKSAGADVSDDLMASSSGQKADLSDGMRYLTGDTFKVTGIVNTADYIAKSAETYGYSNAPSGAVDALAWVPEASFDAAAFQQAYPVVNVRSSELENLATFGDDYDRKSDEIERRISTLGEGLAQARFDHIHDSAQAQVDDAERQLNDAKAQIAEGEQKIADGEAKLEQGRATLDKALADGQAALDQAHETLVAGEAAKAEAEQKLSTARQMLQMAKDGLAEVEGLKATGTAVLADMKRYLAQQDRALQAGTITQKEYNDNLDRYGAQVRQMVLPLAKRVGISLPNVNHSNFEEAIASVEEAIALADDATLEIEGQKIAIADLPAIIQTLEQEVSAGQSELDAKSAELSDGWARYNAGQDELATKKTQGEKELADGQAELENAKQRVEDGKAQVAENEPKLESAKKKLADLLKYEWSVLPRAYNAGATEITTFSSVTNNLSISMAALFIVVGLLVSYFAVSRIVREQVAQIGTKKALGFRRGEVTKSFLLYSGIAVLAGSIIGAIVGYLLVEGIIGGVLGGMFAFGGYPPYFGLPLFLAITAAELALILAATYLACRSILKQHAVDLLRGEKPSTGKVRFYEKWDLWENLPLFMQTIVNNCVNDRRRVLSTIVGVAGSTALIVTAITLNNDVLKSYDRHYEDVYGFNAITYVEGSEEGAADDVESAVQAEGAQTTRVFMKRYLTDQPNGKSAPMRVVVPFDDDSFQRVYHVNTLSGAPLDLAGGKGAWVSEAYAEHMGVKVGDVVTIDGGDGKKHEVPILGFYEFWLTYHEMVMGLGYFQEEFGEASASAVLAQTGDKAVGDVERAIARVEGFDSIVDDATYQHQNFETFSSVSSAVVAIYLALAALMAVVVLLNLNVMFIEEKKRELIVLMINGFSVRDAKRYVSYDSVVLSVIGIIVGIALGCLMGSLTVAAIEPPTATFVRDPDMIAIVVGIVGSAVLTIIMGAIALRRIPRFQLTDINKQ